MQAEAAAHAPVFILMKPQLGENIGAAARVMGNFALPDLRIVSPRDGWPNPAAEAMSAGSPVLASARLFDDRSVAAADLTRVYATTARPRGLSKPVLTAREALAEMTAAMAAGERVGVLFGPEKSGLETEDVASANAVITLPVDPAFPSLNLASAVAVLAHEWRAGDPAPQEWKPMDDPAPRAEVEGFFEHLEDELHRAGFFYPPEKTPLMVQNLRTAFLRQGLTSQEVRTLRGVVKALAIGRGKARVSRG